MEKQRLLGHGPTAAGKISKALWRKAAEVESATARESTSENPIDSTNKRQFYTCRLLSTTQKAFTFAQRDPHKLLSIWCDSSDNATQATDSTAELSNPNDDSNDDDESEKFLWKTIDANSQTVSTNFTKTFHCTLLDAIDIEETKNKINEAMYDCNIADAYDMSDVKPQLCSNFVKLQLFIKKLHRDINDDEDQEFSTLSKMSLSKFNLTLATRYDEFVEHHSQYTSNNSKISSSFNSSVSDNLLVNPLNNDSNWHSSSTNSSGDTSNVTSFVFNPSACRQTTYTLWCNYDKPSNYTVTNFLVKLNKNVTTDTAKSTLNSQYNLTLPTVLNDFVCYLKIQISLLPSSMSAPLATTTFETTTDYNSSSNNSISSNSHNNVTLQWTDNINIFENSDWLSALRAQFLDVTTNFTNSLKNISKYNFDEVDDDNSTLLGISNFYITASEWLAGNVSSFMNTTNITDNNSLATFNLSAGETSDHKGYDWIFLFVIFFIFAGGVGNILVCLAVALDRKLQNVTNYFLFSLAIADLLVSLFVMPLGAIPAFLGKFLHFTYY